MQVAINCKPTVTCAPGKKSANKVSPEICSCWQQSTKDTAELLLQAMEGCVGRGTHVINMQHTKQRCASPYRTATCVHLATSIARCLSRPTVTAGRPVTGPANNRGVVRWLREDHSSKPRGRLATGRGRAPQRSVAPPRLRESESFATHTYERPMLKERCSVYLHSAFLMLFFGTHSSSFPESRFCGRAISETDVQASRPFAFPLLFRRVLVSAIGIDKGPLYAY